MLEGLVVAVIVAAAFCYAAWVLTPATLRVRVAQRIGAWGRQPGRSALLVRTTAAIERAARARAGGCSDCSAAHSSAAPPPGRRPPPG